MTPEQVAALAADATPGPWAVEYENGVCWVVDPNGERIVKVVPWPHGVTEKDAAFIAAAHDMADLIARMDEALRAADALALLVNNAIRDGCPACGGDCASANPPVVLCPQQVREAALAAYRATREKLK